MAVVRGCGTRQMGGVYLEVPTGPNGRPLEDFIIDAPFKLSPAILEAMGITAVGVKLHERAGITHVIDWVGASHYPNVADWLEETRRFGISSRVPKNIDWSKLEAGSRLLMVHPKAWIENAADYFKARTQAPWLCPKSKPEHGTPPGDAAMCASLWWEDIAGGATKADIATEGAYNPRRVVREMPSFAYAAESAPEGVTGRYCPALFFSIPIARVVIVRDPQGGSHLTAAESVQNTKLPWEYVNE